MGSFQQTIDTNSKETLFCKFIFFRNHRQSREMCKFRALKLKYTANTMKLILFKWMQTMDLCIIIYRWHQWHRDFFSATDLRPWRYLSSFICLVWCLFQWKLKFIEKITKKKKQIIMTIRWSRNLLLFNNKK